MKTSSGDDLLPQCFYRLVDAHPDRVYLTQPVGGGSTAQYTFADVLDQAGRMASYLRSLALPPGSRIAIVSKNCAHFFISDLAIWMAGHVSVALYPTVGAELTRYILEHSGARLLLVGKLDAWEEVSRGVPPGLPCIALPLAPPVDLPRWDEVIARQEPLAERPRRAAEDEALIIYTSGSTGRPKGALHTFETIAAPTRGLVETLGVRASDRYLSYLPLGHAMERWLGECISMYAGVRVFFAESRETFMEDLVRARPTVFVSVPRLWLKFQLGVFSMIPERRLGRLLSVPIFRHLVRRVVLRKLGLHEVRFAGSGSAPIPPELLQWYRDLGLDLLEGYGMSENFNYSHMTIPGRGRPGYVGHSQRGVECRIAADGEVLVRSPGTMSGYYREPELTAEVLTEDGWLRTGDLGELDDEGRLRITGRLTDLFKTSKGRYIAPVPIENRLNADAHLELSCVAGAGYPAPHAVVQLCDDLQAQRDDLEVRRQVSGELEGLLRGINARLPSFERLAFLVVAREAWTDEGGQLTPSLKLRRSVIEARYRPRLDEWYAAERGVIWE